MRDRRRIVETVSALLLCVWFVHSSGASVEANERLVIQEQRIEIIIRDSTFLLTQPVTIQMGTPTVIILRNQDIIRHGFTSPVLSGLLVRVEGDGTVVYGQGIEGVYVDPNKTLVIRFTTERPGNHSFHCDLHPKMKGELYLMAIPTA